MRPRFGLLVLAALLVTAALTLQPRNVSAACRCPGVEPPPFQTVACWGKGSTCAQAAANLPGDCQAAADNACGTNGACNVTIVSQGACWWNGTMYQVDGSAKYLCITCIGPQHP